MTPEYEEDGDDDDGQDLAHNNYDDNRNLSIGELQRLIEALKEITFPTDIDAGMEYAELIPDYKIRWDFFTLSMASQLEASLESGVTESQFFEYIAEDNLTSSFNPHELEDFGEFRSFIFSILEGVFDSILDRTQEGMNQKVIERIKSLRLPDDISKMLASKKISDPQESWLQLKSTIIADLHSQETQISREVFFKIIKNHIPKAFLCEQIGYEVKEEFTKIEIFLMENFNEAIKSDPNKTKTQKTLPQIKNPEFLTGILVDRFFDIAKSNTKLTERYKFFGYLLSKKPKAQISFGDIEKYANQDIPKESRQEFLLDARMVFDEARNLTTLTLTPSNGLQKFLTLLSQGNPLSEIEIDLANGTSVKINTDNAEYVAYGAFQVLEEISRVIKARGECNVQLLENLVIQKCDALTLDDPEAQAFNQVKDEKTMKLNEVVKNTLLKFAFAQFEEVMKQGREKGMAR